MFLPVAECTYTVAVQQSSWWAMAMAAGFRPAAECTYTVAEQVMAMAA